jgi:hypothetical protein
MFHLRDAISCANVRTCRLELRWSTVSIRPTCGNGANVQKVSGLYYEQSAGPQGTELSRLLQRIPWGLIARTTSSVAIHQEALAPIKAGADRSRKGDAKSPRVSETGATVGTGVLSPQARRRDPERRQRAQSYAVQGLDVRRDMSIRTKPPHPMWMRGLPCRGAGAMIRPRPRPPRPPAARRGAG